MLRVLIILSDIGFILYDLVEYIAHSLGDLAVGLGRTPLVPFQCIEAVVYGVQSR